MKIDVPFCSTRADCPASSDTVATGEPLDFKASGQTSVSSPGTYEIRFANVDDQLLLWVDGTLVDLGDDPHEKRPFGPDDRRDEAVQKARKLFDQLEPVPASTCYASKPPG